MKLLGLHHVAIKSRDVEALASFYRDVLGLTEQKRSEDDVGLRSIWLKADPVILMIERMTNSRPGICTAQSGRPETLATDPLATDSTRDVMLEGTHDMGIEPTQDMSMFAGQGDLSVGSTDAAADAADTSDLDADAQRAHFHSSRPGLHLLALRIDPREVESWGEHLEKLGVAIVHQTPHTVYVCDPEGNRVGLSSWPEPLALLRAEPVS